MKNGTVLKNQKIIIDGVTRIANVTIDTRTQIILEGYAVVDYTEYHVMLTIDGWIVS